MRNEKTRNFLTRNFSQRKQDEKKTRKGFGEKLGSCYDFLLEIENFSDIVTSQLGHNLPVGRCRVGQFGSGNGLPTSYL